MVTTIQIHEEVKRSLEKLKERDRESYEDIIVRLMRLAEGHKRKQEELLIEGCKEMAEDSLKITKEFENTDAEIDW